MHQDMQPRKFHARVFRGRNSPAPELLLNDEDFRFAAQCERMRVDRNGSVLSLLLIQMPTHKSSPSDIAFLARLLEGRLRVTDTPGRLQDGRVAVLLPDTSAAGAWKVATDLSEVYPPGPDRPQCDVLVYPDKKQHSQSAGLVKGEPSQAEEEAEEVVGSSTEDDAASSSIEFFFARALPLWKRALDVCGGVVGLLASSPILVVAGLSIKLSSPGSIFFSQEREGHGGRRFTIWKLRTMRVDAEALHHQLLEHSHQDGPAFKMRSDPRTTLVGKFLRWSSIDELPQFWNVLKGDMSLVGPRPLPTRESIACQPWQRQRLAGMPGMTCTWQVNGRGKVEFDEWIRMDLRYLKKSSLLEDLKLIGVTLPSLVFHKGMR